MYKIRFTFLLCTLWWLAGCATNNTETPATAIPATAILATEVPAAETDTMETTTRSLYAFGDSWTDLMDNNQIERELADRNLTDSVELFKYGVSGSTADDWANDDRNLLGDLLAALVADERPDPVIFMTLGGNDVLLDGTGIDDIAQNMGRIIEQITAARPDVQIVYGSYDLVNPAISPDQCDQMFDAALGTTDVYTLHLIFDELFTAVAAELASAENVTIVNAIGSLYGQSGNADLNNVSPVEYLKDCIHLNDDGHSIYLDTIFDIALFDLLDKK